MKKTPRGRKRATTMLTVIPDPSNPNVMLHVEPIAGGQRGNVINDPDSVEDPPSDDNRDETAGTHSSGASDSRPKSARKKAVIRPTYTVEVQPAAPSDDVQPSFVLPLPSPSEQAGAGEQQQQQQVQPPTVPLSAPAPAGRERGRLEGIVPGTFGQRLAAHCEARLKECLQPLFQFTNAMRTRLGITDDRLLLKFGQPPCFIVPADSIPNSAVQLVGNPMDAITTDELNKFVNANALRIGIEAVRTWTEEYTAYSEAILSNQPQDLHKLRFDRELANAEMFSLLYEANVFPMTVSETFYGAMCACRDRLNGVTLLDLKLYELLDASPAVLTVFQSLVAAHMLEGPGFNVYALKGGGDDKSFFSKYALSVGIKTREHRATLMDAYDQWFKTVYRSWGGHPRVVALRAMLPPAPPAAGREGAGERLKALDAKLCVLQRRAPPPRANRYPF